MSLKKETKNHLAHEIYGTIKLSSLIGIQNYRREITVNNILVEQCH